MAAYGMLEGDFTLYEGIIAFFAFLFYICAILGLILSLIKKVSTKMIIIICVVGTTLLIVWGIHVRLIGEDLMYGYYCALSLFIAATMLNAYYAWKEKKGPIIIDP